MIEAMIAFGVTFFGLFIFEPIVIALGRLY
jgi:hypothetical protein